MDCGPDWLVHADADMLVLDKPAGLLAVPGRLQAHCLSKLVQLRYADALVVHRLDMATSGLMLMARGAAAQVALGRAFAGRAVHKRYVAVVNGLLHPVDAQPAQAWRRIDLPIRADWPNRPMRVVDPVLGKPSHTQWRVLGHDLQRQHTRLELEPVTGRTHQLRVHLQAIGHPIIGDALYAVQPLPQNATRLLLHAAGLSLAHPITGECLQFTSTVPF